MALPSMSGVTDFTTSSLASRFAGTVSSAMRRSFGSGVPSTWLSSVTLLRPGSMPRTVT